MPWRAASQCGAEGSFADLNENVPGAEETKKESHRTMKLFSRRTDNGFHNSRQVAKCPANLVHGIAGAGFTINDREE